MGKLPLPCSALRLATRPFFSWDEWLSLMILLYYYSMLCFSREPVFADKGDRVARCVFGGDRVSQAKTKDQRKSGPTKSLIHMIH